MCVMRGEFIILHYRSRPGNGTHKKNVFSEASNEASVFLYCIYKMKQRFENSKTVKPYVDVYYFKTLTIIFLKNLYIVEFEEKNPTIFLHYNINYC